MIGRIVRARYAGREQLSLKGAAFFTVRFTFLLQRSVIARCYSFAFRRDMFYDTRLSRSRAREWHAAPLMGVGTRNARRKSLHKEEVDAAIFVLEPLIEHRIKIDNGSDC
jgi:hypothetical protein